MLMSALPSCSTVYHMRMLEYCLMPAAPPQQAPAPARLHLRQQLGAPIPSPRIQPLQHLQH